MTTKKKRRPCLCREVAVPVPVEDKVNAVIRLTKEINRLVAHLTADYVRVHDRRSVLAFERKCHRRGELLEALREQDRAAYTGLIQQLKLGGTP